MHSKCLKLANFGNFVRLRGSSIYTLVPYAGDEKERLHIIMPTSANKNSIQVKRKRLLVICNAVTSRVFLFDILCFGKLQSTFCKNATVTQGDEHFHYHELAKPGVPALSNDTLSYRHSLASQLNCLETLLAIKKTC